MKASNLQEHPKHVLNNYEKEKKTFSNKAKNNRSEKHAFKRKSLQAIMHKWETFIKKQEKKEAIVLSKSFWKPCTLQATKNRLQDKIS